MKCNRKFVPLQSRRFPQDTDFVTMLSGSPIIQYVAAITSTLGIISSEMHYGWPSPSLPILVNGDYKFQISSNESSWLVIMPLIGGIFGALITGIIIDQLGRKRLILFSSIPFFISWLMIAFAPTSILLHVARFMAGLTDGLSFTAVPMYLGEIAEPRIRGLLSSMCPISIVFGILLINILGNYLTIPITAYCAAGIPVILLITFIWMPESPYFLLMHQRYDDAKTSLQILRRTENVDGELMRLSEAVKEQNENHGRFIDLFLIRSNRKAVLITLGLRTVQQLSGVTAIMFYCKTIFKESNDFISPNIATIIYFTIQLILSLITSFVVDLSGRRPLLIISITGTAITLFINGTFLYLKNCTNINTTNFNFIPLIALLGFVIISSLGLQTIPLLIMSEMFPTSVKAFALCLADIYYNIIVSIISKLFHAANDTFGMHVPFYAFAVCCMLGLIFVIFYIPETKGRTLEDIQRHLKGEIKL